MVGSDQGDAAIIGAIGSNSQAPTVPCVVVQAQFTTDIKPVGGLQGGEIVEVEILLMG